jgi:hypothetical protein
MERFPVHVVSKWLGHDPAIALKHNSQTTDEHFAEALGKGGAKSGALVAQKAAKKIAASRSNQFDDEDTKPAAGGLYAANCTYLQDGEEPRANLWNIRGY